MENWMELTFPSLSVNEGFARAATAAFASLLNPTIDELSDLRTAVSEAVTNAIIHGYGGQRGTVRLRGTYTDEGLLYIDVIDKGKGIADVARARQPLFTTGGEERSGMGFTIMESFMDRVTVRSAPGRGVSVIMRKRLSEKPKAGK